MVKVPVSKKTVEAIGKIYDVIDDILAPMSLAEDRKLPLIMDFIDTQESLTKSNVTQRTNPTDNKHGKAEVDVDVYPLYRLRMSRDAIRKKSKNFDINVNDVLDIAIDNVFEHTDEFVGYLELLRHEAITTKE